MPEGIGWTRAEINAAAEISTADVDRALALIAEASPERAEMMRAEEADPEETA